MSARPSVLIRLALPLVLAACAAPAEPDARAETPAGGTILTSFDRLTLARGSRATFRAALVSSRLGLGSAGLGFTSRAPEIARVTATGGRAVVEAVGSGHTWIGVRAAGSSDSVEVVVE
jgi:hypothetical protein